MSHGTVTGKIIASHLVSGRPEPGEPVSIRIDQTLTQDATGTMAYLELEAMGVDRVRTGLSVSYVDHNTQQNGPENRNDHLYLRSVAAAKGVVFSPPGNGICHQVHLERFGAPGLTLLGSDSHTPTNGGVGMLAIGAGGLDVALAMAGKPFRLAYPRVVGVRLDGALPPWTCAKDIILKILGILTTKGNVGVVVEYFGPGVASLSVPERATVANMGAELGVTSSVFPSDARTRHFLAAQGRERDWRELLPDPGARYDRVIEIDLSSLSPMVACPSSPDNVRPLSSLGSIPVDQVLIGSCTNGSLRDMRQVAAILHGRSVAPSVTLAVAPGSRQVLEALARDGSLASMVAAGARVLETACGPCIGQGQSPAEGAATVRTFNRNFSGRTGTPGDQAYIVGPPAAAAAAIAGALCDPASLGLPWPEIPEPDSYPVDDRMLIRPPPPGTPVEIVRKSTIGSPPRNTPMPAALEGVVAIKVGDKITTDHIMPAGAHLKHRSNIPAYAKVVFECFNKPGRPTFAERAATIRDSGRAAVVVARESYGQGSSREHAAICPMFLGVRLVLACSIERIHSANLVNFGIAPLLFANPADYEAIDEGDTLSIPDIRSALRPGRPLEALLSKSPSSPPRPILLSNALNAEDVDIIMAGGVLNMD